MGPFLPEAGRREGLPMIFYMFTDMKTQSTDLMYWGDHTGEIIRDAFGVEPKDGVAVLPGVVSRKKQLLPPLLAALQARQGSNRPENRPFGFQNLKILHLTKKRASARRKLRGKRAFFVRNRTLFTECLFDTLCRNGYNRQYTNCTKNG